MIGHDLLQVISVTVNRYDGREVFDFQFPHGFRSAELLEAHAQYALNALRINLRCSADRMEINATILLAVLLRFRSHAAFADDSLDAKAFDDVGLIRFFANRRSG